MSLSNYIGLRPQSNFGNWYRANWVHYLWVELTALSDFMIMLPHKQYEIASQYEGSCDCCKRVDD